jgi:hypothetical protein
MRATSAALLAAFLAAAVAAHLSVAQNATPSRPPPATPPPTDPPVTVAGVSGLLEEVVQRSRIPTSFIYALVVVAVLGLILYLDKFFPPATVADLPGRERRLAMLKPPRAWTVPPPLEGGDGDDADGGADAAGEALAVASGAAAHASRGGPTYGADHATSRGGHRFPAAGVDHGPLLQPLRSSPSNYRGGDGGGDGRGRYNAPPPPPPRHGWQPPPTGWHDDGGYPDEEMRHIRRPEHGGRFGSY